MLELLGGVFGSGAFGAVTGLVGGWLTKLEERKTQKMNQEHEAKMRQLDIDEAREEHARALEVADKQIEQVLVEGEIAQDVAAAEAFAKSQEYGNRLTGVKWVDGFKGLMRPLITLYLLALSSLLALKVSELTGGLGILPHEEVFALYKKIINELMFLTTTAVTWWFAARQSSQRKA